MRIPAFSPDSLKNNQFNRNMQRQNGTYFLRKNNLFLETPQNRVPKKFALKQLNGFERRTNKKVIVAKMKRDRMLNSIILLVVLGVGVVMANYLFGYFF